MLEKGGAESRVKPRWEPAAGYDEKSPLAGALMHSARGLCVSIANRAQQRQVCPGRRATLSRMMS